MTVWQEIHGLYTMCRRPKSAAREWARLIRRRIPRVVIEASAVEACPGCVVLSSVVVASVHKQQKDEHERCAEDGDWEISGLCPDGAGPAT